MRKKGKAQRRLSTPSPAEAMAGAAAMSLVLGDDDLLGEILLRLALPTTLVRAALACKRWLRVASGPAFLRRFRALHPPRLLGFYANGGFGEPPEFWPVRHPPEFASAVRRAASVFRAFPRGFVNIVDALDGRLLVSFIDSGSCGDAVLSPLLYPGRDGAIHLSSEPAAFKLGLGVRYSSSKLLPDHGSDGVQCLELLQIHRHGQRQTTIQINKYQYGAWRLHTSVTTELLEKMTLPVALKGRKFYITSLENIFVLDLVSSTCSVIDFPENNHGGWLSMSKADDSGFHLISVTENSHLCIWLHQTVSGSLNNWLLVNTICLHTVFADLRMPVGPFRLCCAGDNAEFVLLEKGGSVFYFNIHNRAVEKVFEMVPGNDIRSFFPLMMIWPPRFPSMKARHYLEE